RRGHDVDGHTNIRREDEPLRLPADEASQRFPRLPKQRRQAANEKIRRFRCQLSSQLCNPVENTLRKWSKGTGIEIANGRIKQYGSAGLLPKWIIASVSRHCRSCSS